MMQQGREYCRWHGKEVLRISGNLLIKEPFVRKDHRVQSLNHWPKDMAGSETQFETMHVGLLVRDVSVVFDLFWVTTTMQKVCAPLVGRRWRPPGVIGPGPVMYTKCLVDSCMPIFIAAQELLYPVPWRMASHMLPRSDVEVAKCYFTCEGWP